MLNLCFAISIASYELSILVVDAQKSLETFSTLSEIFRAALQFDLGFT